MLTLTSTVGRFEFPDDTQLSHAKLVRDTIMGQVLSHAPRGMVVREDQDAQEFMASQASTILGNVEFEWFPSGVTHVDVTG